MSGKFKRQNLRMESLEDRVLMAGYGDAYLAEDFFGNTYLQIDADPGGHETIRVYESAYYNDVSVYWYDNDSPRAGAYGRFDADLVDRIVFSGSERSDVFINMTDIDSSISGNGGDDSLRGGGGRDTILGGNGDDTLWGGDSTDFLYGQDGEDGLFGEGGTDYLNGGYDGYADILNGGADHDYIIASWYRNYDFGFLSFRWTVERERILPTNTTDTLQHVPITSWAARI